MALLYVEGHLEDSPDSELASENIKEGLLVARESGGGVHVADASTGDDTIDGIALNFEAGDNIAHHDEDYRTWANFVYKPASNKTSDDFLPNKDDRVPIGGHGANSKVNPITLEDTSLASPNIGRNDLVGIAAFGACAGKVVEDGYTADPDGDGTSTTYSVSNGNLVPLGYADEPAADYGVRFTVRRAAQGF